MVTQVVFYVTERGEMPVLDFLHTLNEKEAKKCLSYIDMLFEFDHLPSQYAKALGEGLYELRPEFGGTEFRLFYVLVVDDVAIMLHAIKKKTQRTPERDLTLAKRRMEEVKPNER